MSKMLAPFERFWRLLDRFWIARTASLFILIWIAVLVVGAVSGTLYNSLQRHLSGDDKSVVELVSKVQKDLDEIDKNKNWKVQEAELEITIGTKNTIETNAKSPEKTKPEYELVAVEGKASTENERGQKLVLKLVRKSNEDKNEGHEGPAGIKGDKGPRGDRGERGERGEKGDKGERGDRGDKGEEGAKGKTGDQGKLGPAGPQGPPGTRGGIGPTGPTGLQGGTGATPPPGPRGQRPRKPRSCKCTVPQSPNPAPAPGKLNDQ